MKKLCFLLFGLAVILQSCGTSSTLTREQVYPGMYKEQPLSIAVMPPINRTNNVEAKEFFYLTLPQVVCDRGYYVLSPLLGMEMYKTESAYDAELYATGSLSKFRDVLGADAALFTYITDWSKSAIGGTVTVSVEYVLRSTKTDETIFQRKGTIKYDTSVSSNSGGVLGALVGMAASAVSTAATDYTTVAKVCNQTMLSDMPAGKYNPSFDSDKGVIAGPQELIRRVSSGK